jgi:hypothetical protein
VAAGQIDTTAAAEQTAMGVAHIYPHFKQNYLMHDIALVNLLTPFALTGLLLFHPTQEYSNLFMS